MTIAVMKSNAGEAPPATTGPWRTLLGVGLVFLLLTLPLGLALIG